jgi:hypothetical protein
MSAVRTLMIALAGALIFCTGVTIFVMLVNRVDDLADNVRDTSSYDTSLVKETRNEVAKEHTYTYQDVMSELFTDTLQYDLEIDGVEIKKEEYNLAMYDELPSFTAHSEYTKILIHDTDGNVTKVRYVGS